MSELRAMRVAPLLIVTALAEAGAGLFLLLLPAVLFALLFGWREPAPETLVIGRVAGAGLLGLAVASWLARHDRRTPALLGLLAGLLLYNAAAAVVLAFAGAMMGMAGLLLWPAVAYHAALAAWSFACSRGGQDAGRP